MQQQRCLACSNHPQRIFCRPGLKWSTTPEKKEIKWNQSNTSKTNILALSQHQFFAYSATYNCHSIILTRFVTATKNSERYQPHFLSTVLQRLQLLVYQTAGAPSLSPTVQTSWTVNTTASHKQRSTYRTTKNTKWDHSLVNASCSSLVGTWLTVVQEKLCSNITTCSSLYHNSHCNTQP